MHTSFRSAALARGLTRDERTSIRLGQYRLSADVIRRAGAPAEAEARSHSSGLLRELERVGSLSTAEATKLLGIERAAVRNMFNELAAALDDGRQVSAHRAPPVAHRAAPQPRKAYTAQAHGRHCHKPWRFRRIARGRR